MQKNTQADQLDRKNTVSRSTGALAQMAENQSSKMRQVGSEKDAEITLARKAVSPAAHKQREMGVANHPEQSISKPDRTLGVNSTCARELRERCRQLCVSLFFREQATVHSLGFTSAVGGEGKSFLARLTAEVAAHDNFGPTTLLECDWDDPSFHKSFGIPATPGLAEWLRGECLEADIRYPVGENLSVIPAGDAKQQAVKLLRYLQRGGIRHLQAVENGLVIVDLPPILTTGYGALAASLVESIIVVVRAGVTPNHLIKETCEHLKVLPVEGLILNQKASRIPGWIRKLL